MNRSTTQKMIAVALGAFGIYRALYVPGMLVDPQVPLLLVGIVLQAAFGIVAGVGVWRGARWATLFVGLLCAAIVATALVEVLVGIVAYLRALLEAAVAIVLAFLIIRYVRADSGTSGTSELL